MSFDPTAVVSNDKTVMGKDDLIYLLKSVSREDVQKAILLTLSVGVILTSPVGTRILAQNVLRELKKGGSKELSEESIRKSLYNLQKKKYVQLRYSKDNTSVRIGLTSKGKDLLRGYEFKSIKITKPKTWDGKWRIVVFDIPEKSRYARDILRDKIKRMGFFRIQQSVWVHPFPCKEEVRFLAEFLSIESHILVFEDKIANDKYLRQYFSKKGFYLA